jgi:hypothetical protein
MNFWSYVGHGAAGAVLGGIIGVMIGGLSFSLVVKMPQDASASDYSQGIASELCGLFIGGIVGAVVSIRVAHKK